MKSTINKILAAMIWISLGYLLFSFFNWNLNPQFWGGASRFIVGIWTAIITMFYFTRNY